MIALKRLQDTLNQIDTMTEPPTANPSCPQCNGGDNKPYVTESGIAMRACFRCLIQWRDESAGSAPDESELAEWNNFAMELFDNGIDEQGWPPGTDIIVATRQKFADIAARLAEAEDKNKRLIEVLVVSCEWVEGRTCRQQDSPTMCFACYRIAEALAASTEESKCIQ